MAKKNKFEGNALSVAKIAWVPSWNIRLGKRDENADKELVAKMVGGWHDNEPCTITSMPEGMLEEEMKRRFDKWQHLKENATSTDAQARLKNYENHYTKGGKLIEPEFRGLTGNGRGSLLEDVWFAAGNSKPAVPQWDTIPVIFKDFSSETDVKAYQIQENEAGRGTKQLLSGEEKLKTLIPLYRAGYGEMEMVRKCGLSRGDAQKYHRFLSLDSKFPNLKLVERPFLPPGDEKFFPISRVRKEEIHKKFLHKDVNPSEREVEQYFLELHEAPPAVKGMTRADVEELRDRNKSTPIINDVLEAVLSKDKDKIVPHYDSLDLYALAFRCTKAGKHDAAVKALVALLPSDEASEAEPEVTAESDTAAA